jgi:hypothetical protein
VSTAGASDSYTLITPTSVTASSFVSGTGGTESTTLIETEIPLTEEEVGIFYADLTPELYASDVTYDLVFYVQYTPEAPVDKKLTTRFRLMPFNVANQLDFEIGNSTPIEYEVIGIYN